MKKLLALLLIPVFFPGVLLPAVEPGAAGAPREIHMSWGNDCSGICIEHYKEKNGWTPVILFTPDLEIFFHMDKNGRVIGDVNGMNIDLTTNGIRSGESYFPFTVVERNPVRTRARFSDAKVRVTLKLDALPKQVEVFIGTGRLLSVPVGVTMETIAAGVYRLTVAGPSLLARSDLIYRESVEAVGPVEGVDRGERQ
ncbi:MAG: hypothetical protein GY950_26420 [bacterium]|nr:hypothetical protein [bacterium]